MKRNIGEVKEMGNKQYVNSLINNSATIREALAEDLAGAPHKAVRYNGDGRLAVPAADGDPAIGVLLSGVPEEGGVTKAGTQVDVLIRHIGLAEAGEALKKGDFLAASATGALKKAAAGHYILGIAMTEAALAGDLVQVQITNSGYAPASN